MSRSTCCSIAGGREELRGPRTAGGEDVHGTGCALASAIAAYLAHGRELVEACRLAKQYVAKLIENPVHPGRGASAVTNEGRRHRRDGLHRPCAGREASRAWRSRHRARRATRSARKSLGVALVETELESPGPWSESLAGADAIIHLAGEPSRASAGTRAKKQISRLARRDHAHDRRSDRQARLRDRSALVCASGVDYYPFALDDTEFDDDEVTESDPPGDTFLGARCVATGRTKRTRPSSSASASSHAHRRSCSARPAARSTKMRHAVQAVRRRPDRQRPAVGVVDPPRRRRRGVRRGRRRRALSRPDQPRHRRRSATPTSRKRSATRCTSPTLAAGAGVRDQSGRRRRARRVDPRTVAASMPAKLARARLRSSSTRRSTAR